LLREEPLSRVSRAIYVSRNRAFIPREKFMEPQKEWWTASRAAESLKMKPRTLLKRARCGEIKGYILSGTERITWRFLREDLDATLRLPSVALKKKEGRIQ
jgi:hypothetical protein